MGERKEEGGGKKEKKEEEEEILSQGQLTPVFLVPRRIVESFLPGLYSEFQASLGYTVKPRFKNKTINTHTKQGDGIQ